MQWKWVMKATTQPISIKLLISFYLIIPVCIITQLFDQHIFAGFFRHNTPQFPHEIFALHLIFGAPHIIASSLILLSNRDYLVHYRRRIQYASIAILLFLTLSALTLPFELILFVILTVSIVHVIKQQIGIGNIVCRLSGCLYQYWIWTGILIGTLLYNAMFLNTTLPTWAIQSINVIMLISLMVYFLLTVLNQRKISSPIGLAFLWSNFLMVAGSLYLYQQNYFFLAILAPRVIHDATAFTVYIVHDRNRHQGHSDNPFFTFLNHNKISIYLATPFMSVALAYIIQYHLDHILSQIIALATDGAFQIKVAQAVIVFFSLFHYYTESFTWGKKSPYRKYIAFKM